jgi:2-methylisocitrate lyase-like PEP mutase family enzyme
MPTVAEKRRTFRALHEAGCFVIPNPWDVGTARYLQHLGFKALATTSSGAAYALAKTAWAAFIKAAREIATSGRFDVFTEAKAAGDLDAFFKADAARRTS